MSQDPTGNPGGPADQPAGWGPPPAGWGTPAPGAHPAPNAGPNPDLHSGPTMPPNPYQQFSLPPRPAKPGVIELRPLGLSDLLDGTFAVLRRAPMPTLVNAGTIHLVLGLLGVLALYVTGIEEVLQYSLSFTEDPEVIADIAAGAFPYPWFVYAGFGLLAVVLYFVAYALIAGPATVAAMRATLNRPTSWREGLILAKGALPRLIGLELVLGFAVLIPVVALGALGGWLLYTVGIMALIPLLLAGVLVMVGLIWIGVRLTLAPILVVSQSLSVGAAIARSWRLTRGSWWRVFGIVLVVSLVISVLAGVVSSVLSVAASLPGAAGTLWFMLFLGVVVNALLSAVSTVLLQVLVTLLQVDLRIRRERLDVGLLGELVDPGAHPIPGHDALDYTQAR